MGKLLCHWSRILAELRVMTGKKKWTSFGPPEEGVGPLLRRLKDVGIEPDPDVSDERIRAKMWAFVESGELTADQRTDQ